MQQKRDRVTVANVHVKEHLKTRCSILNTTFLSQFLLNIRAIAIKTFYCHYIIFHKTVITNNTIAAIHVFPIPCNLGLMEARLIRMASSVRMVRLPWLGQVFK